jgi:lipopolysaccharide transport system permease protein
VTTEETSSSVLELTGEATPVGVLVGDLWRARALLPMLAAKDFHARYRSASLGVIWSVALPLLQGAVLAVVFTRVVRIGTDVSYPVFVLSGMIVWSFFSQSLSAGSTAIVDASAIASKVYFPRMILAAVPALANTVSFAASVVVVIVLMVFFHVSYHASIVLVPVAMALDLVLAVLIGELATLAHVYFRDVRYIVQAALLVGLYATPVIYPLERAHQLRGALIANPMTGVLQLIRWALFGRAASLVPSLVSTGAWIVALAVATLLLFRRHERISVDRL